MKVPRSSHPAAQATFRAGHSALASALLALTLGAAPAGAQTLVTVNEPNLPFTVSLPKSWLGVNFNDGAAGVSVVSAKTPPATLMRLLYTPKGNEKPTPASEFSKFEQGVKSTGATIKQTSSRTVGYGGVSGVERNYTLTHPKGKLNMRVWYGVGARNLYSFQLTDTPERFTAASATFSKVLASVKFR
ncbi:hypothetical protein GCM10008959_00610 [Deinococcus seoulensis]|uniref:PsbP C-terminal domain-containing protein n=2 Tax=Deinococcus TaxID=1298 RepID=A0ABQ2RL32_9DEIO|nr:MULTISPECIES: hypothetical protein [Deinococcus]GGR43629.1 hypothetical protein GCM10008959_00610 [Deinococcus seoulensis]GGS40242.1 hypothetical protein GCM10008961_34530 [Deinococcus knuensis]